MIWLPLKGWEDRYTISDQGDVMAIGRKYTRGCCTAYYPPRLLLKTLSGRCKNYHRVTLCRGKYKRKHLVHILVAETFLGPQPPDTVICHKNDNGFDNRVVNLYYGTAEQNQMDKALNKLDLDSMEDAPF